MTSSNEDISKMRLQPAAPSSPSPESDISSNVQRTDSKHWSADTPLVKFRKHQPYQSTSPSDQPVSSDLARLIPLSSKTVSGASFRHGPDAAAVKELGLVRLNRASGRKVDERPHFLRSNSRHKEIIVELKRSPSRDPETIYSLPTTPSERPILSSDGASNGSVPAGRKRGSTKLKKRGSRVQELNRKRKRCWIALKAINERFGLKHLILTLVLVAYAFLGAVAFYTLESPHEESWVMAERAAGVVRRRQVLEKFLQIYSVNCSGTSDQAKPRTEELGPTQGFDQTILANRSEGPLDDSCGLALAIFIEAYERRLGVYDPKPKYEWDFWNSLFFACTVFTTIGYGHLACRTLWGRLVTVIYALVGIPLMLTFLNGLGDVLFKRARLIWNKIRRYCRRVRTVLIRRRREGTSLTRSLSRATSIVSTNQTIDEPYENFPLPLAIGLVFIYVLACAALFRIWETNWDYWTAIYFFFVSLTTIGFGDIVPDHPRFTILGFVFFIIGLALVSMCINVIQAKVEKKYKMYFDLDALQQLLCADDGGSRPVSLLITSQTAPFSNGHHKLSIVREVPEESEEGRANENRSSLGVMQIVRYPQPASPSDHEESTEEASQSPDRSSTPPPAPESSVPSEPDSLSSQSVKTTSGSESPKYPAAFLAIDHPQNASKKALSDANIYAANEASYKGRHRPTSLRLQTDQPGTAYIERMNRETSPLQQGTKWKAGTRVSFSPDASPPDKEINS